jgi:GT2 family glycosyltransferase
MKSQLAIAILFFEKVDQTIECIKSFLPSEVSIYILNNGSSRVTTKKLLQFCTKYKQIKIFHKLKNTGVSAGRNFLLQKIKEDWILFVDNDIVMKTNNWLPKIQQYILKNKAIEVFIPKLYNVHEKKFVKYKSINVIGNTTINVAPKNKKYCNIFPGGASFINKKMFKRLGTYDESIFVNLEDFELSLRGVLKKEPIKSLLIPDIKLAHNHKIAKAIQDKKIVQIRYSQNNMAHSFEYIYKKHHVNLYQGNWKTWLLEQKVQTVGNKRDKLLLVLRKIMGKISMSLAH